MSYTEFYCADSAGPGIGGACAESRPEHMATIPIAYVVLDEDGRMQVYPDVPADDPGYKYIYRDATGVRWDNRKRCLYGGIPRQFSHQDWFEAIRDAVEREYGDNLVLTKLTEWVNISDELRANLSEKFLFDTLNA